ncbi:N-terminal cleavage protein [Opitutaceae bacterium TAV5]|nr:N-terminal cleavage protein [Opitutaceae bacterium TAV5]
MSALRTHVNTTHRLHQRGFTLVELLVVIAILGVLAGILIPAVAGVRMVAKRIKCASNMRQIGTALIMYAGDHRGMLPQSTHSDGINIQNAWIFTLAPYLSDVDEVRVCPADNEKRQEIIRSTKGYTSYLLNNLVFDPGDEGKPYNNIERIPIPSRTMILFSASDDYSIGKGSDHTHADGWTNWYSVCSDIEPNRHRLGPRGGNAMERLNGSANYLHADAHVKNIKAADLKKIVDSGINPAAVPE